MNLNLIAGSFSRMGFLLSWETIIANQLWTQPFHKSYFQTVLRRVPRLIPVLPQTRQSSAPAPPSKSNWEYWFCCVIIIAFINRGCKTKQSPLQVTSPQGQVCVCVCCLPQIYDNGSIWYQIHWFRAAGQRLSKTTFAESTWSTISDQRTFREQPSNTTTVLV